MYLLAESGIWKTAISSRFCNKQHVTCFLVSRTLARRRVTWHKGLAKQYFTISCRAGHRQERQVIQLMCPEICDNIPGRVQAGEAYNYSNSAICHNVPLGRYLSKKSQHLILGLKICQIFWSLRVTPLTGTEVCIWQSQSHMFPGLLHDTLQHLKALYSMRESCKPLWGLYVHIDSQSHKLT